MSKPSAKLHAGRLLVPLQALTLSVADILKDLDPLVDENMSTSKHDFSKWAEQSVAYRMGFQPARPQLGIHCLTAVCFSRGNKKDNPQYLANIFFHPTAAQYSIVRVFVACKSNIKANKNM